MDADGSESERALEVRMARLEARLRRLEGAAGLAPDLRAQTHTTQTHTTQTPSPRSTVAPPRAPSTTAGPSTTSGVPQWLAPQVAASQPADRPPGAPAASAPIPLAPWVAPEPMFRLPSSFKLPDLSGSLNDIEERLAGRALAWVGGLALILGAIFFLSLAFSRGWIGEELRVVIGLVAGAAALAGGAAFMERGNRLLGLVLTPVGLAIVSISLVAATTMYGLVPVEVGLAGALVSAIAAAVIAVRANSQIVAAFGLIAVLIAPPIMGASPDMTTLLFIAVVLVGTTGIALWRSWSWLPPVAFILSAPQAASWISGGPETALGLTGIALYWLLNIVAAGGEAFHRRRDDLSASSATLMLANVAFLIWAGFSLLDGDLEAYRGFFLVLVALAHLGIGGYFVGRDGERNLFGLLTIGTGIAALTMAAPIQLGAPAVPIAWTAEAVALAWLAARRGHPYSAVVSAILYALAGAYVLWMYSDLGPPASGVAFANPEGASLGFFAAGVAAGIWFARDRSLRSALAAFGLGIVAFGAFQVLDSMWFVVATTVLMVAGTTIWRALPLLPNAPIVWLTEGLVPRALQQIGEWRSPTDALLPIATVLSGLVATVWLVVRVYLPIVSDAPSGVPFADPAGATLAVYLIGLAAVALISGRSPLREPLAAIGLLVVAWACIPEFDGVTLVAAWAGLMVLGFAMWRGFAALPDAARKIVLPSEPIWTSDLALPFAALAAGGFAVLHVLLVELPVGLFGQVTPPEIPFTDAGAATALILVVATLATGALVRGALARRISILIAGRTVAYAIPFEVYAWSVSVLWVGLGGLALAFIRVDRGGRDVFLVAAGVMVAAAGAVAVGIVAPPSSLVVGSVALEPIVLLQSIVALGAVVAGLVAIARTAREDFWARWVWLAAGVSLLYLLSIAVVGVVATQVGGSTATEELQTQGQVALSVLWAVLGLAAFVVGLRLRIDDLRHGGLALLGLATAKVFLFDLSALDVAYRVISLIALGLLLLTSAWVWQRLQPRPPATPKTPTTPTTPGHAPA